MNNHNHPETPEPDYDFNTVARAIGHLHKTEKLWQDSRGRMCVRGSKFAAVLPVKK